MSFFRRPPGQPPAAATPGGDDAYERKKARESARGRKQSAKAREISPVPPVKDPARKAAALESFQLFCESYFPNRFRLAWSPDHLTILADFERIIVEGGLEAIAMPRGSGKTSIAECAVLWAIFRGKDELVGLIGATERGAKQMLASIDTELRTNERLAEDFPEVCYPIHQLEGINQRRLLYNGERVTMTFTKDTILLPNLPENPASSAIIKVSGITGHIRGMKYTRPKGRVVRPQLVVIDDPQTDRSAKSLKQNQDREALITGTILGLAGPGRKMRGLMPCTVICPGDLAERFLDRTKRPEWNGRRTKLLESMPENLDLWAEYKDVRDAGLREEDGGAAGNAFFLKRREELCKGAKAAWEERFNEGEICAVQSGMNLYLDNPETFFAEYQNDPAAAKQEETKTEPSQIIVRQSGRERGIVPLPCEMVAAGIDVQQKLLYWTVVAAESNATPYVLDYNAWPDQKRVWFSLRDSTRTIQKTFPKQEADAQLYAALEALIAELVGRELKREDGSVFRVGKIVIDARWRDDVIFRFCKQSPHSALLVPAFGLSAKGNQGNWKDRKSRDGFVVKHDYRLNALAPGRPVRHLTVDSDAWISRVHNALQTPMGSPGALTLFKQRSDAHLCYAEHLCAEYSFDAPGPGGRKVKKWELKPGGPDNHWLDATKLAMLGTYMLGAQPAFIVKKAAPRKGPRKATPLL